MSFLDVGGVTMSHKVVHMGIPSFGYVTAGHGWFGYIANSYIVVFFCCHNLYLSSPSIFPISLIDGPERWASMKTDREGLGILQQEITLIGMGRVFICI